MKTPGMRRWWLLAVAALALLGTGELLARTLLGLGTPVLYVAHPSIEYMMRPNQDVHRFGRHIVVNEYGMRSASFPAHKGNEKELRVLVMGDSVVNGGAPTDQSRLATTILGEHLARDTGRPVIVGNVSAGSWGPQNLLAWANVYGFLDADYVVVVLSSHDASDVPTFEPLNPLEHPTHNSMSALLEGATRYLPAYLPRVNAAHASAPKDSDDFRPPRAEALDAARDLIRAARAAGSCVSLVQHLTMNELAAGAGAGHDAFSAIADEAAVFHVSDTQSLAAARAHNVQPYRDNIHFNDAGQAILEKLLLEAVEQCGPTTRVSP